MKTVQQFIATPCSPLFYLTQHLQQIEEMQKIFYTILPSPLNQHCHLVNFKEDKIVVHVDSALWHTKFRFEVPKLLAMWQQQTDCSTSINAVEIRIRPPGENLPSISLPAKNLTPSYQTIELLRYQAENLSYPPLKRALSKLVKHFLSKG